MHMFLCRYLFSGNTFFNLIVTQEHVHISHLYFFKCTNQFILTFTLLFTGCGLPDTVLWNQTRGPRRLCVFKASDIFEINLHETEISRRCRDDIRGSRTQEGFQGY